MVRIVASKSLRHRWHDLSPQIGGLCDEAGIETSLSMRDRGEVLPRDGIKEDQQKVGRWLCFQNGVVSKDKIKTETI